MYGLRCVGLEKEVEAGELITGFHVNLPLDDATLLSQVDCNLRRGLPEVMSRHSLIVVANGPSARNIDLKNIRVPTLAVNGAIRLFVEQGVTPTYWAACDPQALVADFLPDNPPRETIYLVASKCHMSVFDKLKEREVRVWRVGDHKTDGAAHIPTASSITITASWLMRLAFYYTDFDYYGWDGCFMDGRHHAFGGSSAIIPELGINYGGIEGDGGKINGGKTFPTTRTWAAEAKAAGQFFQFAKYLDMKIVIHGDGLFAAHQRALFPETMAA